ncbi:MAG TPA: BMP family ABC transporter substrate-binding protein, partial [Chloroflexi bacterium]|nr:BMP family ABC transporter substrate-binding protein [Chloroflexota bacterium]
NTWYDPVIEREAAVALLDQGADVITQHQDTTEPQKAAQESGALSIGYDSDMRAFVGDTVLTSPIWNWGVYYVETVQAALDGTWETHQYWGGLEDGIVELAPFSSRVPQELQDRVAAARQNILAGNDVFCGPINDQAGNEVVPAGTCMSDGDMLNMSFFVEGVVGTISN